MKKSLVILALACAALVAPSTAAAKSCSVGDSGISYNRDGEAARFKSLEARGTMNCPSARYVLNDWLRAKYEKQHADSIPTRFYDGYVYWRCRKLSKNRWQCSERETDTSFRFTAYVL
ncbi:hypothetical protein OJ998_27645 [Solirubrobacter taibaiensis]|nr:hypothetical protein [Solirubrobacter taibaiensis]